MVYNNQPIEVLMEACKLSISQLSEPVWYSCEVNQRFSSELGIEDLKMYVVDRNTRGVYAIMIKTMLLYAIKL